MKLNIYKNQNDIEKTYEIDEYDLMYGTVEDIFEIMDELDDKATEIQIFQAVQKHRSKLTRLLKDIFPEITEDELRRVKLKELVPMFIDLFNYVSISFVNEKN